MTYCLGKLNRSLLRRLHLTLRNTRSDALCAPSAIRTRALGSNPAVDAVAISDDAGQVRSGTHCCSPSYLVITRRDTGHMTGTEDAARIVSQEVATSRSIALGQSAPARRLRRQSQCG